MDNTGLHQGCIHPEMTWGLGYYIGQIYILLKRSLNIFQAYPCRINAFSGSLVQGEGGWYRIEFRIAIDMKLFGYHIYMLYNVRDSKRVVVEATKSW